MLEPSETKHTGLIKKKSIPVVSIPVVSIPVVVKYVKSVSG